MSGPLAGLLPAAILVPWLAAAACLLPAWRRKLPGLAAWCALPALIVALVLPPGSESRLAWLLLDVRLAIDEAGLVFLRFSALIWLLAGAYGRAYLRSDPAAWRFFAFYLTAVGGNVGLLVAADLVSFYLFFAVMGLACYGLVFHDRDREALRAGRIYLVFVICGDVLLFAALVMLARAGGGIALPLAGAAWTAGTVPIVLLVAGLGIKLGAVPLHSWLPIAHPAAPIPASAVLSGVVIKSGLFGWLRFLPLGETALPDWAAALVAIGLVAVFYGAAAGTAQRDPKTVLAYSSVSQMGLITVGVGLGLSGPAAWPAAQLAILAYATHHALAKSVLFLGVGTAAGVRRRVSRAAVLAVLGLGAASLAGLPFTSGAAAKAALKTALDAAVDLPAPWLPAVLQLGAAATSLLMARLLWLIVRDTREEMRSGTASGAASGALVPWALLAAAMVTAPAWPIRGGTRLDLLAKAGLATSLWPIAVGGALAWLLWVGVWRRSERRAPVVPPGDLLVPLARGAGTLLRAARTAGSSALREVQTRRGVPFAMRVLRYGRAARAAWERADGFLRGWRGAGTMIVLVALLLIGLWRLAGS